MEALPSSDNAYQSTHLQSVWRAESAASKMVPFYRGGVTQPSADRPWPGGRIEGFSTTGENKRELPPMFAPTVTAWPGGQAPDFTDFERSRVVPSRIFNNAAPTPQLVGPGLGLAPDAPPAGGFHQFEARDYAQDRNVDELRTLSKPRASGFEARTLAGGAAVAERGLEGAMQPNRTPKAWETGEQYFLTTTGGRLAQASQPAVVERCVARACTGDTGGQAGPVGPATAGSAVPAPVAPAGAPLRHAPQDPGDRGLATGRDRGAGAGRRDDYGRAAVQVYGNERDLTTCATPVANLGAAVSALTAPLLDLVKWTRKVFTLDAPRELGQLQATFPSKATVAPDDAARPTVKETTLQPGALTNLRALVARLTVSDPDDVARTTVNETTLQPAALTNLRALVARLTVYDPNDTARTTLKETLIHDVVLTNFRGPTTVITYDPDYLVAKPTVRETVASVNPQRNMRAATLKLTMIDPDDRAKTTVKETAIAGYRPGGPEREAGTGYLAQEWDAKMTQRASIDPDTEYGGNPTRDAGGGYLPEVTGATALETQRSTFTRDPSHTGGARAPTLAQTSEEAERCAYVNATRDGVLAGQGRAPTTVSASLPAGRDFVRTQPPAKASPCAERQSLAATRISAPNAMPCPGTGTREKERRMVDADAWLDPALLDAYRKNPYTLPLDSY